jgi:hypothetical protein
MQLFRIITQFWGKDLSESAQLGYVVAETEEEVADHISRKHCYGAWFGEEGDEDVAETREDYIANKGDIHTQYAGEFYDQKYGWEIVDEVTDDQVALLRSLGIIGDLATASS